MIVLLLAAVQAAAMPPAGQTPLVIDRLRPDRVQPGLPPRDEARSPRTNPVSASVEGGDDAGGTTIRGVSFAGTRAPEPVARAAEGFLGRPTTKANLHALATAMSDAYAKADIGLYTLLIPEQTFADGIVIVRVIEGHVESVTVEGDAQPRLRRHIARIAERLKRERPLSRVALERYVSLIRDVPGVKTDIQLLQGSAPGAVRVVLTPAQPRSDLAASFDNRTTQLVRDGQFQVSRKFYSLARGGDQTDIVAATAANFRDYRYPSAAHATPIGANGTRLTLSTGYLETKPRRSPIEGDAVIAAIQVSHPLIRSYRRILTVSASFDGIDSDNAAFGSLIATERTRTIRAAAGYVEAKDRQTLSAGLTLSRGIDLLGARITEPLGEVEFTKVNGRATFDREIGRKAVVRLRAAGQWTRDRLPGTERFSVGGEEFGRAFETALISADRGIAGLAELAWKPGLAKALGDSEVYAFADGAEVKIFDRGPFAGGDFSLASAGLGTRLSFGTKAAISVEAAKPISRPVPGYDRDWRLSVGWRLSFGR